MQPHTNRLTSATAMLLLVAMFISGCGTSFRFEQRYPVAPWRTIIPRYNAAFFYRHYDQFRVGAASSYSHARAHDDLQLTPLSRHEYYDSAFNAKYVSKTYLPPHMMPMAMLWGPYTGKAAWKLYRAIDWGDILHMMVRDIFSKKAISWQEKQRWIEKAVDIYLERNPGVAMSPAVMEYKMRQVMPMMKPYFWLFRNEYPLMATYFYSMNWWGMETNEGFMISGNDDEQNLALDEVEQLLYTDVLKNRPQKMLLSREGMPRFAQLSPRAANIFDNLRMLNGLAYAVMAYEGWSLDQKRRELYRIIDIMTYQEGDENFIYRFDLPHPDIDPRIYYDWMQPIEGTMYDIAVRMTHEMWPHMNPNGAREPPTAVLHQLRLKFTPGTQEGEVPGSLYDAWKAVAPEMKVHSAAREPGRTPHKMIKEVLKEWKKYNEMIPPVQPYSMEKDPDLPPLPNKAVQELLK